MIKCFALSLAHAKDLSLSLMIHWSYDSANYNSHFFFSLFFYSHYSHIKQAFDATFCTQKNGAELYVKIRLVII